MTAAAGSPDAELDRLIAASHEGVLTYADRDRLEQLLRQADARSRYRKLSMLHASLVYLWHHSAGQHADDGQDRAPAESAGGRADLRGRQSSDQQTRRPPAAFETAVWRLLGPLARPTPFSLAVAAITIGSILAVTAAMRLGVSSGLGTGAVAHPARRPAVATVAAVHQAVWRSPAGPQQGTPLEPGDFLLGDDRLQLASGLAELAFFSGGRVVIEGPAEIVVIGRDAVRVEAGRIVVRTEHGPRGDAALPLFTVATPRGLIKDLGTEFGVDVPVDGSDSVHVFEGVVAVAGADGNAAAGSYPAELRLEAGTSAAIDADHSIRRVAHVAMPRFVRSLPEVRRARRGGGAGGDSPRPAAWHGENVEEFDPARARFVRFTIFETSGQQPCLDELEVFATDGRNMAREGTATASGTLPGHAIHEVVHVNDGLYGNDHSWICDATRGWIQIELPAEAEIDRIVWSRDRTPSAKYVDRVPTKYLVSLSLDGRQWQHVAHGSDRLPFGSPRPAPEPEDPPAQ